MLCVGLAHRNLTPHQSDPSGSERSEPERFPGVKTRGLSPPVPSGQESSPTDPSGLLPCAVPNFSHENKIFTGQQGVPVALDGWPHFVLG